MRGSLYIIKRPGEGEGGGGREGVTWRANPAGL